MIYSKFYSELGKLLYAVADNDGFISQKEKRKLEEIVKKELVPVEMLKDEFGSEIAYYTEMKFDFLDEEIGNTPSVFESFIGFIEENKYDFDDHLKKASLKITNELTDAYRTSNKKERFLIGNLKDKLQSIKVNHKNKETNLYALQY